MEQRSLYLIRQALNAVFKRRRMAILLFLLIFVPVNVGTMFQPPRYRAAAKLLLTNARIYPEVSPLERQASVDRPPNETLINSEVQLLRSRDLLRRVQFDLELLANDEGEDRTIPGIKSLEGSLSVLRKPGSNVIEVAFRSADPQLAIDIVNTVVSQYAEYSIEQHTSSGAVDFFRRQVGDARLAFENSDLELERYDAAHGLTSIAVEKDQLLRQRAQLEADMRRTEATVTELATKAAALEAELVYIPEHEAIEVDMIPNPMIGFFRQNLARLEMEQTKLLRLYTPQHRLVMDVDAEISSLKHQLVGEEASIIGRKRMATTSVRREVEEDLLNVQADLGALEARGALLSDRISDYDGRIRVMHSKHYQVMRLRRVRTQMRSTYDSAVQKLNQLEVSAAMDRAGLANMSIVEAAALPLRAEADFKGVTFVLSLFAALLLGVASAVVTEMLNPVMNSEVDIRHHLGLPVLAEIPQNGIDTNGRYTNGSGNGQNVEQG
jgi:uncharacterized protein involved in exopolysaccharide biosynthesis